jgi:hypothetical protein
MGPILIANVGASVIVYEREAPQKWTEARGPGYSGYSGEGQQANSQPASLDRRPRLRAGRFRLRHHYYLATCCAALLQQRSTAKA